MQPPGRSLALSDKRKARSKTQHRPSLPQSTTLPFPFLALTIFAFVSNPTTSLLFLPFPPSLAARDEELTIFLAGLAPFFPPIATDDLEVRFAMGLAIPTSG